MQETLFLKYLSLALVIPVQTYENMPTLTGTLSSMAFALNGNFAVPLAVGGTGGLQVYVETNFEADAQNIPEGPAILSTSLLSTPITQVAWDRKQPLRF